MRFTRQQRLSDAVDFKRVFSSPAYRSSDAFITLLASPNQLGYARLGIVVAKKVIKTASRRNYVKRIIRESFRLSSCHRCSWDVIVIARSALRDASSVNVHAASRQALLVWFDAAYCA